MAKYIASTVTYDNTGKVVDTWGGDAHNILDDNSKENSLKIAVEWEAKMRKESGAEMVRFIDDTVYYFEDGEEYKVVVSIDEL